MKQILQDLSGGETLLVDVPVPGRGTGEVLLASVRTLISLGTERMLVDFGRAGLVEKARRQPDKVKQVLDKVRTDGLLTTVEAVRAKLDQPLPLGYCHVGRVLEADGGCGLREGDRVISNGPHAEVVCVPRNLCAPIPEGVSDDAAAFVVPASIGLQGIRLLAPTIGESVMVFGLGLIGLLSVRMLLANGCRVIGVDTDPEKCRRAAADGADVVDLSSGADPIDAARRFSRGRGVDGVLITASAPGDELIHQAAEACRQRGRIVLVGVVGLNLRRDDFFRKELTFQVSCSYGPGRYDPEYEGRGRDYPFGFVRWTEGRNFEAVLDLMASGRLEVEDLVTHRFPFGRATEAYRDLSGGSAMGIVLEYDPGSVRAQERRIEISDGASGRPGEAGIGVIGSGAFATRVLLPEFVKSGAAMIGVASRTGVSGGLAGRKFGFQYATTEPEEVLKDASVTAVVVSTRHDSHARYVVQALREGKHVFVEKPLGLTSAELDEIRAVLSGSEMAGRILMVGFNRRFSPLATRLERELKAVGRPASMVYTVNGGAIPADHWTQRRLEGGGRIVGEGCHFIDLLRFFAGSRIVGHRIDYLEDDGGAKDTATITLRFENGGIGTVHYFANGHSTFPKERVEVFAGGKIFRIDNWRRLEMFGGRKRVLAKTTRQDKGHAEEVRAFVEAVRSGGAWPIPSEEIFEVSRVSVELGDAAMLA